MWAGEFLIIYHIFIFFDQSCFLVRRGKLTFLGGYQNSHPMPALLPYHRLNIDRCMINIKHLMTGPEGNSEFCFPRISMFPEMKSRETLRFEGNKIHCSPRDQSLSDLLYSKTKQKQNLKTALRFQRSRATAVNISRVTVNCFPFDVIVFAMLPAHGIWRETVSLLDVM